MNSNKKHIDKRTWTRLASLVILLCLFSFTSFAQQARQDSLFHVYDSLAKVKLGKLDSSNSRANKKIDSVQQRVNNIANLNFQALSKKGKSNLLKRKATRDSVKFQRELEKERRGIQQKIDSLREIGLPTTVFEKQLDSLAALKGPPPRKSLATSKTKIDSSFQTTNTKWDNVTNISVSTNTYTNKLDSIKNSGPINELEKARTKVDALGDKATEPAQRVEKAVNEKLELMQQQGGDDANLPGPVQLPGTNASLGAPLNTPTPNLQLPNGEITPLKDVSNPLAQEVGELKDGQEKISDLKTAPQEQLAKVKSAEEVQQVQQNLNKANVLTDKAQAFQGDAKAIAQGDLNEVKELPNAIEQQAAKLEEVQVLQKEAGRLNEVKNVADMAKDPEALVEKGMQQAPMLAMDHFAGKQEVLQSAMDKMDKLKKKYGHLKNVKDNLPRRMANAMYGKPFVERLLPGITLQIQRMPGAYLVDYNPYVGYRLTGRLTSGAGWNERVEIGRHAKFSLKPRVYGPRAFVDYKFGKGVSIRADIEKLNSYVPVVRGNGITPDEGKRLWVWSVFVGIKKEYSFMKGVNGNVQALYNLYDDHDNSPYSERFCVRMGFEFPLRKKKKPSAVNEAATSSSQAN